jgi:outer membrane protein TolC
MSKRTFARVLSVAAALPLAGCIGPWEPGRLPDYQQVARREPLFTHQPATRPAETDGEPIELTDRSVLADYLAYAALHNPAVEAAFYRWRAAVEQVPQARALPDPRFTYRYFIREVETRVGPQRQSFGIAQTFPWLDKLPLRADAASEAAHAAWQRYQVEKLRLFHQVKAAYHEYAYLDRAIAVARENLKLLSMTEAALRVRYKAAAARHPDLIRAQVEQGKLEDRQRALEALRGPVAARLNAALSRPPATPLPPAKAEPIERIAASDAQVLGWAREVSPQLVALRHEIKRNQHGIELARRNYLPDLTIGLDYVDVDAARMPGVADSGKDVVAAMFSINLPIWHEKYSASVRQAKASHLAAVKHHRDRTNLLAAEIKMALYRYRDAVRRADLFRDTLLPKAEQGLKATEAAFRGGKAAFTDLLDAQRVLLEFQLAYERARADSAQQLAEVEMLAGRPIPRAGEPIVAAPDPTTQPATEKGPSQ